MARSNVRIGHGDETDRAMEMRNTTLTGYDWSTNNLVEENSMVSESAQNGQHLEASNIRGMRITT